jgi:hypothetical protein
VRASVEVGDAEFGTRYRQVGRDLVDGWPSGRR